MKYRLEETNKFRKWKAVLAIMAAIVIAMTTYNFATPSVALADDQTDVSSSAEESSEAVDNIEEPESMGDSGFVAPENAAAEEEETAGAEQSDGQGPDEETDPAAKATKTTLTERGKTYHIDVTYGEEAGIPEDAALSVEEISEKSDEYDEYLARTADAVGEDKAVDFARFFDIKIMSGDEEIQPADTVDVRIELKDELRKQEVAAIHFGYDGKDETKVEDVVLDAEVTKAETKRMDSAVSFETDGFSVYAIATVSDLETAADLSELDGNGFYLSIDKDEGRFYAKDTMNGNYIAKTNVADIDSAVLYYFEKVSGTEEQFYIYVKDGETKKYVNVPANGTSFFFSTETKTAFTIEQNDDPGTFYIYFKRANGQKCAWTYNGSGFNGAVKGHDNNNKVVLTKPLQEDPYGLDDASYGIVHNINTISGTALMNQASGDTKLKGLTMTVRTDTVTRTSNVLVAKDSNITMWTFSHVSGDQYYITTEVDGATKYLSITNTAVKLADESDESCLITIESGTGKYKGKLKFSSGGQALRLNGSNFERIADLTTNAKNDNVWMNLAEKSNLNDDDFVTYTAEKVSVSGTVNDNGTIDYDVKNGDEVVVYTRVWNEDTKKYDFYVIDYDGVLVKAYASGDSISWVGSKVNTMLWDFTEYYNSDGTPNYYYELQNQYSKVYIAPQVTNGKVLSDNPIGINLNGRRNKEYYTTVLAWDDPYYDYASLKIKDLNLTSAPISKADTFYFAVMKKEETVDKLTQVATVDHKPYGITIKMQDYGDTTTAGGTYRSREMSAVIGDTPFDANHVTANLLTKNINDDYPTATITQKSLGDLFDEALEVNHQFLTGTYKETGYFEYDSTQNFAHLVSSTDDDWFGKPRPNGGKYEVGDFVVYEQLGTTDESNKNTLKHGQFLPYNDLEEGVFCPINTNDMDIHTSTTTAVPLSSLDPRKGEKLYNIHYDSKNPKPGDADHFFGVDMSAKFMQSASGLDEWGHDLIFEFSGDDDFWFYVDGKLILDLGGIHSALDGSINFRTGKVVVHGTSTNLRELFKKAYLEEHPEASASEVTEYLDGIFKENEEGVKTVFKDYSGHTMRMFYMERGAGASNLHMRFNLAPYKDGEVQLKKEVSGIEKPDSSMVFPFQIWYQNTDHPEHPYERITDQFSVLDSKTENAIPYENTYEVGGMTYEDVFLLKPDQTALIQLPEETTKYFIRECGMDTQTYDQVKINDEVAEGKSTGVDGRENFDTEQDTVAECKKVIYNNHVSKSAQHSLNITKLLWEDREKNNAISGDSTLFSFRIYIGKDSQGNPDVYNTGKYYVKNPKGEYCIYQNGEFFSTGQTNFDDLSPIVPPDEWESEQEKATFETSPSGIADKIPVGYTVEVPGLMSGNAFMVVERTSEIPAGYELIDYDRKGQIPEGESANEGTIHSGDEFVAVNNRHGYGLHVEKKWSDAPFMDYHNPIYFAVYLKGSGDELTLLDDSLLQLGKTETSLQWFFHELEKNKTLNDYLAYEVIVKNEEGSEITPEEYEAAKDPDTGKVVIPSDWTVTRVEEGGIITVEGKTNEHAYATTFDYTASYDRETLTPEQIAGGANSRKDKVSNSRPGLKLIKTDMSGNVLEGATFTLENPDGTMKKTFTSDEDGLIAVAYLTEGEEYTLTETIAPYKYRTVVQPLTVRVDVDSDDGSNTVYVNGSPETPVGGYYEIKQEAHPTVAHMPAITIKNKPFKLNAVKKDLVSGVPVEGAVFELYREVKDYQTGNLMPDYTPMEGFDYLETKADGTIPQITMDDLKQGTYYLRERSVPSQYKSVDYDVRLIIEKTGDISIEKAEYSKDEGKWVFSEMESDRAELSTNEDGNVTLTVKNTPKKIVRILKKAEKTYGDDVVLPGVEFALYTSDQPEEGEVPILTGTTDENGILDLGALKDNSIYYMFETKTPTGYVGFDSPVIITVKRVVAETEITATLDGEDLAVQNLSDEGGMKVTQITLKNKAKNTLEITKTIDQFIDNGKGNDVTFVFEVNGYAEGQTEPVYTKRVGMQFIRNGDRTQTLTVKGIPSGLERLMVKEVYSGDYTVVADADNPEERQAAGPDENGVYTVSFVNELKDKTHSGGVVNKYEQDGNKFKRLTQPSDSAKRTHHR